LGPRCSRFLWLLFFYPIIILVPIHIYDTNTRHVWHFVAYHELGSGTFHYLLCFFNPWGSVVLVTYIWILELAQQAFSILPIMSPPYYLIPKPTTYLPS
jgi:hypothetical protein